MDLLNYFWVIRVGGDFRQRTDHTTNHFYSSLNYVGYEPSKLIASSQFSYHPQL
jgi:hypothetical protein